MKKTINNPIISKIIAACIFLLFALYCFFVSSYKTNLVCENNFCSIKTINLLGEINTKNINYTKNEFYCTEKRKLNANQIEDYKNRNVWILTLNDEKIFKYTYKDSCYRELTDIKNSLNKNNNYSNVYEHFFINILYKFMGIVFLFISLIILISKVSPINIEIKTKTHNRKY